jgi:Xaa-Pro aminopeptidase
VEPGHIVNVDFGVRKDGYCSDLQRTWYVLRPGEDRAPEAVQRGFETIVAAIRMGAAAIRPGRTGAEIDDVVRGHVTSRGYAEYPHGTGHQIGRVAHDGGAGLSPRWERYGQTPFLPIEPGQCFTIEPRLTVEGHGIATCEEIVAVGPDGARLLSRPQEEIYLVQ